MIDKSLTSTESRIMIQFGKRKNPPSDPYAGVDISKTGNHIDIRGSQNHDLLAVEVVNFANDRLICRDAATIIITSDIAYSKRQSVCEVVSSLATTDTRLTLGVSAWDDDPSEPRAGTFHFIRGKSPD